MTVMPRCVVDIGSASQTKTSPAKINRDIGEPVAEPIVAPLIYVVTCLEREVSPPMRQEPSTEDGGVRMAGPRSNRTSQFDRSNPKREAAHPHYECLDTNADGCALAIQCR